MTPDDRGMGVIPMCDCGLPTKVQAVHPTFFQKHTTHQHFLGCPKEEGKCGMAMWCQMMDMHAQPEQRERAQVYDELVEQNLELESHLARLDEE
ncbi:hypothetical protein LINPERHAP2_LOCUS31031, partial [Linum perenne]